MFINDISPEKAYTRFIIRYSKKVMDAYYEGAEDSNRSMRIKFEDHIYVVQYLHDIDEMHIEIEIQAVRCKYECKKM